MTMETPIYTDDGFPRPQNGGIVRLQLHGSVQVLHGTGVVLQHQPAGSAMALRFGEVFIYCTAAGELGECWENVGIIMD